MEALTDDGWTQARRCLEAMAGTTDEATRRSLWRAAARYARRDIVDRTARERTCRPVLRARFGEEFSAQFGEG